jgi:hypothetical protein
MKPQGEVEVASGCSPWIRSSRDYDQRPVSGDLRVGRNQLTRLVKEFLAVFGGTDATHLPEYTGKVLLGFESASDGDIQHT